MANILANVDILDLVVINVFKGTPTLQDPSPFVVTVDPLDQTKKVVFDPSALKVLNDKLTEKIAGSDAKDLNTVGFIKEFAGKMISGLYKNGLVIIEDIPDAVDDPYAEAKKQFRRK